MRAHLLSGVKNMYVSSAQYTRSGGMSKAIAAAAKRCSASSSSSSQLAGVCCAALVPRCQEYPHSLMRKARIQKGLRTNFVLSFSCRFGLKRWGLTKSWWPSFTSCETIIAPHVTVLMLILSTRRAVRSVATCLRLASAPYRMALRPPPRIPDR